MQRARGLRALEPQKVLERRSKSLGKVISEVSGSTALCGFPGVSLKAQLLGDSTTCLSVFKSFPSNPFTSQGIILI